jgi:hypothetical protein
MVVNFMRPYRLIGKITKNHLTEKILATLMKWQEQWCVDIKQPGIDFSIASDWSEQLTGFGAKKNGDYLVFCLDSKADWKKIILGYKVNSCPDDVIAAAVISDAKKSLIANLLLHFNIYETVAIEQEFPSIASEVGDGHVRVQISLDGQVFYLWLSPGVVSAYIPAPSKYNGRALTSRADACTSAVALYKTKLNLGSFPIALLQNLAVGDILSTDIKLETPMYLEINQDVILRAHLGQQEGHKALVFISN